MKNKVSENEKNTSMFIHLSTFLKYFFPFANFFAPVLIWTINKDKAFVDEHGKQAINFQLSILVYSLLLVLICLPFILYFASDFIILLQNIDRHNEELSVQNIKNLTGFFVLLSVGVLLFIGICIFEIFAVINASLYASRGELYKYPLNIPFIKTNPIETSQNEHAS